MQSEIDIECGPSGELPDPVAAPFTEGLAGDRNSRALRRAALVAVAERGYRNVAVKDLLEGSGISRATFYTRYTSKQECVTATVEEIAARVMGSGGRALAGAANADERLRVLLRLPLELAAERPESARVLLLESFAAGPAALDARARALDGYAAELRAALSTDQANPELAIAVSEAIAGAMTRLVLARLATGREASLPELADPLTRWAESYRELLAHPAASANPSGDVVPLRRRGRAPGTLVPTGPAGHRRLPPGPTRGPRSLVEFNQRDRILDAVATLVAEEGYDALTTRAIAERAEVSLRTLYERFDNVEDAFSATLLTGARGAFAGVLPESLAATDPAAGLCAGLTALTAFLAEEQAFAKVALVDALASGTIGLDAQVQAQNALAATLLQRFDPPAVDVPRDLLGEAIAAGAWELCSRRLNEADGDIRTLARTLSRFALTPLVGVPRTLAALS